MSEQPPQDAPPPGTPARDILPDPYVQQQDNMDLQEQEEQLSQEMLRAEDADGGLSTTDDDDMRKMSQDSLISGSGRVSPLLRPTDPRRYQDSDSCPSVSPSPDPESRLQTFDFSTVEAPVESASGGITAALQTEREFLDFMLSLPQVQKEGPGRPTPTPKQGPTRPAEKQQEGPRPASVEAPPPLQHEQRSSSQAPATLGGVVSTKMGLDHLDNLCRMMEQLGDLKEQNSRLQRRVHYLEELQTLQEMHRHLQETLEARRSGLRLDSIHLSDSDPHLDDDGEGGGGEVSRHGSEDSLLLLAHHQPNKGKPRSVFTKTRLRSKSMGPDLLDSVPKTKVSGWKRVREALKWERATLLPPAPTPATATSAHHLTSPQPSPSPHSATLQDQFFRPPSSSSSSSVMTEVMTEEDLLSLYRQAIDKNQLLDLPESRALHHSASEDGRRVATLERDPPTPAHDKEKKGHRSAWGMVGQLRPRWSNWGRGGPAGIKVKNMISTRRDSVRKKSTASASHRKSTVERSGHSPHAGVAVEISAVSDPEDYEVDYDGLAGEMVDSAGPGSLILEGSEAEWETGGVWAGPREDEAPTLPPAAAATITSLGVRRSKPQLTITVPSSEDLSHMQHDPRTPALHLPRTPPSPRRASHWTKVKKAFLTGQQHQHIKAELQAGGSSSLPPSPSKKTSFQFDTPAHLCMGSSSLDDAASSAMALEASPDTLASTPSPQPHSTPSPQPPHAQQSGVQRNLADLQKSLSGEFNRRLLEWEKLKGGAGQGGGAGGPVSPLGTSPTAGTTVAAVAPSTHSEDNLPYEFRKKLLEWEKMKERERERGKPDLPRGQEDVKTKMHGEDDLPADFRKKLTEWEIRKALVGKSQQNVEELQKNLGEEFNRKMAEWERIKASATHGHIKPTTGHLQVKPSSSVGCIQQVKASPLPSQVPLKSGSISDQGQIKSSASTSQVVAKAVSAGPGASPRLDRKGSGNKIKKSKSTKVPVVKAEGGHKGRDKSDKELQWLEKELLKVERETQRLEREKEKFLERQARLEKMRQAMGRGGPAKKKEIYIKTSTGEFRFEGISQTFTKKLYEWEERRGIRPESSTIALLDPNYKAPEKEVQEKPKSPELVRLVRSRSESSMAADHVVASVHSQPSSLSLNEMETDEPGLQAENKAASEPTLAGDDSGSPKVAVLVQLEEVVDEPTLHDPATPYAPAEITRNIDSSGSEEDVTRRRRADDDEDLVASVQRSDSSHMHGSYRSLLHENMSLLDKLRQQEDLCRALETQMGDIDSKMDNVADQHLRTLEKLHRQVTIMKDSSSTTHDPEGGSSSGGLDDAEANQRLINQLKSRIVELEMRGDHLMSEKEQLERAFKLHKDHETQIAESLVERIRELQDAGAEVNIQTVQCQNNDLSSAQEGSVVVDDSLTEGLHKDAETKDDPEKVSLPDLEKETETRKKSSREVAEKEEFEVARRESRPREHRKVKKYPPKKVQKLHNLTGDLLFQAKRLEQALVAKHGLERRGGYGASAPHKHRSLGGRSSLRLAGDTAASYSCQRRGKNPPARTWSSIEAITFPGDSHGQDGEVEHESAAAAEAEMMTSKSCRGHSSTTPYSCDQQELLAMNAELSRMAKELRLEMMKMWSFRDSTSPESVTSEPLSVQDMEENTVEKDRLVAEANEVFQNIALLHQDSPPHSPHVARSPSSRSRKSASNSSLSKVRDSAGVDEKRSRRGTEDRDRRSANSTPSRKNSYRQQHKNLETEEDQLQKEPEISVFLPGGATLGELLMRTQQHRDEEEYEEEDDEDREEEETPWEVQRRRSSDGLSTLTSGASRSHSSPSIASSAPEAESSSRLDEDEDSISLPGTWRTATTSTTRSGEHILSSSFEWEEEETEERKKPRGRWRAVVEDTEDEVEEQRPRGRWKAVVENVEEDNVVRRPKKRWRAVVDDEEEEEEGRETPKPQKSQESAKDDCTDFVTEVTVILPAARRATRDLRTRRISDTQVEYESFGQNNRDECFANTFSKTVYDDEALTGGRLSRNPSVRRANSRDAVEDSPWRHLRALPFPAADDAMHTTDKSPDVFVPTKRTIFTVQGGNRNPEQARATPTFVESQDEDQETSGGSCQGSQSHPKTESEGDVLMISPPPGNKDKDKNSHGIQKNTNLSRNKAQKSEVTTPLKLSKGTSESEDKFATNESQGEAICAESSVEVLSVQKENSQDLTTTPGEKDSFQENSLDILQPTAGVGETVENPSFNLTQHQPPTTAAITAALLQIPTPTSPPIESKRKVLEAVNEGVPAVRNIIQKFNKRITENQELLGSPFRSPPTSPPWQSPRAQRKILAEINSYQDNAASESPTKSPASRSSESPHPMIVNPTSGVLKSQSTSVIVCSPELPPKVQRSASGSCVQENQSGTNDIKMNTSAGLIASPQLSRFRGPSPGEVFSCSSSVSPAATPAPTDLDTSCDLEFSTYDVRQLSHDRLPGTSQPESRSPAAHIRALRLKKAKEEFLARGAALTAPDQRSGEDTVKLRHRSGTTSTEGSWRESDELCTGAPSPTPTEESAHGKEETRDKPPRATSRRRNIPKKESFRRQSAGCLLEESASAKHPSQVVKSSSSGVLSNTKRHSRYSVDSQSPDRRKDSASPSTEPNRSPLGIFRLFRRHRSKDKRDMPSVQKLCRQSLLVDIANGRGRTQSASPQPRPESHLRALPEVEGEDAPEAAARSSKTLPRGSSSDAAPLAPTRSCPSSPVAPHRSRTANWLARGRQIFKSRSPSPGKKTR